MFVVIGDAHLKSKLWRSRPLEDDAFVAFEQAIRFAIQHDAEAIIFPGDTFDPVTSAHMARYQEIMELYDGPVLGIQGQHDYADPCWFQVGGSVGRENMENSGWRGVGRVSGGRFLRVFCQNTFRVGVLTISTCCRESITRPNSFAL